jgi:hypothetical protein
MTASPLPSTPIAPPEEHLLVGELSRRLAAELASAAALCQDCEHIVGDLAQGGAALANLTRLQALDELSQRLHGLSAVLQRISQHASGEWSMSIEPPGPGRPGRAIAGRGDHRRESRGWRAGFLLAGR